jgi:hypothetical protein
MLVNVPAVNVILVEVAVVVLCQLPFQLENLHLAQLLFVTLHIVATVVKVAVPVLDVHGDITVQVQCIVIQNQLQFPLVNQQPFPLQIVLLRNVVTVPM